MGFFDKIFGKENKGLLVRAQYRDSRYFEKEIDFFEKMIQTYKEDDVKIINKNGALTGNQLLSYCGKYNKIIECEYSAGFDKENIKSAFRNSLDYFSKGWSEDFQDYTLMLKMVSWSVLLRERFHEVTTFVLNAEESNIEEVWKPDPLIYYLMGLHDKKRTGSKASEMLYKISQLPKQEAEISIKSYLENWYELHKEDPWYNTHLRDKGYSGYWAWEVGAVVKKMGLDDSSFKDNPYYPYDMVHWKE